MSGPRGASMGLLAIVAACGCGPGLRPATSADFAAFQHEEAAVARGVHAARDPGGSCATRAGGAEDACAAASRHCARARRTDDVDARTRCAEVARACTGARAAVPPACGDGGRAAATAADSNDAEDAPDGAPGSTAEAPNR